MVAKVLAAAPRKKRRFMVMMALLSACGADAIPVAADLA
jgi:hypothetical protein